MSEGFFLGFCVRTRVGFDLDVVIEVEVEVVSRVEFFCHR